MFSSQLDAAMLPFRVQGALLHTEAGEPCLWSPPPSTSLCVSFSLFGAHYLGSLPMDLVLSW